MRGVITIGCVSVAVLAGQLVLGQTSAPPMGPITIDAFAVSMGTVATGANAVVEITVNRWSTAEERQHLITTMLEKGSQSLLSELQKTPVNGRFRIPGLTGPDPHALRLGHDLHYAWQTSAAGGGRRIVLITDRYIGFNEARSQPRSIDYPFTIMEIRVDAKGAGEGKFAVATMISFDKKTNSIALENYSSEPVRLQNVTVKPAK